MPEDLQPWHWKTAVFFQCRQLDFEDVWAMFGEGRHPSIARLYETRLAPFLTQTSHAFWKSRLHYFRTGLYYQGGMVHCPCSTPINTLCP